MTETAAPTSIIETITNEKERLEAEASRLRDRIAMDNATLDQTEAELNRASAALAVFQTTPQPRVRAGFLTGRRG
jgi:chromosome segregation ATPase